MSSISCDCERGVLPDHRGRAQDRVAVVAALPEHVRPAHDGVERRAQLVRERGQEFVLDAVRRARPRGARPARGCSNCTRSFSILMRSSISADSATLVSASSRVRSRDVLFQLLLRDPQRLLAVEQLDEHRDLGSQHVGRHRLDQVIHRADGVAAEHVLRAPVVRGQEDDRRLARPRAAPESTSRSRSRPRQASPRRAGSARSPDRGPRFSASRPDRARTRRYPGR